MGQGGADGGRFPMVGTPVKIKNGSGSAVARFGVLGISDVAIHPSDNSDEWMNEIVLVGVTPTTASYTGKFAVCVGPIADGEIGLAWIDGTFPCSVNVTTAGFLRADVKNSDATKLQSGATGAAQILWIESGTGTKNAVVRITAPSNKFLASITGSALVSGSQSRWQYAWSEVEETATGWQVKSGGRTGTTSSGFALNSIEAFNATDYTARSSGDGGDGFGVGEIGPGIVPGYYFIHHRPIDSCVVEMTQGVDTSGGTTYRFSCVNAMPVRVQRAQIPTIGSSGAGNIALAAQWVYTPDFADGGSPPHLDSPGTPNASFTQGIFVTTVDFVTPTYTTDSAAQLVVT
jgi:hypothetical protein